MFTTPRPPQSSTLLLTMPTVTSPNTVHPPPPPQQENLAAPGRLHYLIGQEGKVNVKIAYWLGRQVGWFHKLTQPRDQYFAPACLLSDGDIVIHLTTSGPKEIHLHIPALESQNRSIHIHFPKADHVQIHSQGQDRATTPAASEGGKMASSRQCHFLF